MVANRYNYRKLYAETVSGNRMDWINAWRESVAEFLAASRTLHSFAVRYGEKYDEYVYRRELAKERIVARLNLIERDHVAFFAALEAVDYTKSDKGFITACVCVETLTREILKPEWERVKKEAKGKGR